MLTLCGQHLINGQWTGQPDSDFHSFDPATNAPLPWQFADGTEADVNQASDAARAAFLEYRSWTPQQRAGLLEAMADAVDALGDTLTDVAHKETALPRARLEGERGRTCGQLRLFASLLRGPRQSRIIDLGQPRRTPLPKPDIRLDQLPLGPVAVFGASNFPLAFSAAGGDTASALAAGCPVVIKGHPAHPATTELVTAALFSAIERVSAPRGVVNLIQGRSPSLSRALVQAPAIQAVGFTGSFAVGQQLSQLAAGRPQPIPFFGELGSVNPQFLLEETLAQNSKTLAQQQLQSMMMGQGQFCTSPGLVVAPKGAGLDSYLQALASGIRAQAAGTMLTPAIAANYHHAIERLSATAGVHELALGLEVQRPNQTQARAFVTSAAVALCQPQLLEEVFGPVVLVIETEDDAQRLRLIDALPGQLTATVHGSEAEMQKNQSLITALAHRVGRLIANQMPTGVEVCHAMQHGGPWPAATHSQSTSVGAEAIKRFTRPLAWQNMPQSLLPPSLRDNSDAPQLRY
ncbi:NADP-dependent aldehyde dehydrogenase [Ferrimonas sediminum]|uniref:NADP-dependent aldehyde dehydrogenase n=1 Tax=Ferrimonas sediminum TaxID=718193 RepID=A0A1G9AGK8_9GAMM|nr:aldehyde dehydrogenase (NADP(+)) [Ferrimonas sediminum]SDK25690.1 NADP-dependent aldehyde dehydrogenase [Ferrimonas sediminum]